MSIEIHEVKVRIENETEIAMRPEEHQRNKSHGETDIYSLRLLRIETIEQKLLSGRSSFLQQQLSGF